MSGSVNSIKMIMRDHRRMRPLFLFALLCPLAVEARTVVIEDGRCRFVEIHKPAPDVAYQPGVDVTGKAVVPADLGGGNNVRIPNEVTIPLTVPLTDFVNPAPPFLDGVDINVGEIVVDRRSGAITYGGQRLDPRIAVLCDDQAEPSRRVLNVPLPPPVRN